MKSPLVFVTEVSVIFLLRIPVLGKADLPDTLRFNTESAGNNLRSELKISGQTSLTHADV